MVTDDMLSSTNVLESEIKAFNQQIKTVQQKLDNQNKIISSSDASTQLNKQMVKFTEEKAKYTNNLLTMYSFLNVVAVGLLIYVYKSSTD
jgi:CHASE3 domain sensor protein